MLEGGWITHVRIFTVYFAVCLESLVRGASCVAGFGFDPRGLAGSSAVSGSRDGGTLGLAGVGCGGLLASHILGKGLGGFGGDSSLTLGRVRTGLAGKLVLANNHFEGANFLMIGLGGKTLRNTTNMGDEGDGVIFTLMVLDRDGCGDGTH